MTTLDWRVILERTARMGGCSQTHHEHLQRDARAALAAFPARTGPLDTDALYWEAYTKGRLDAGQRPDELGVEWLTEATRAAYMAGERAGLASSRHASIPQHSATCAAQGTDEPCICGVSPAYVLGLENASDDALRAALMEAIEYIAAYTLDRPRQNDLLRRLRAAVGNP